jgi:hypothetical protein
MPMSPRLLRPLASGFNPNSIANLALWLDASATSSLTFNADTISEWRDLSGNGRHFSQATAAAQPNGVARTKNGKRVLDFGGAQSLVGNSASLSIARNVGGITAFVVAKFDSVAASQQTLMQAQNNASVARLLMDGGAGISPGTSLRLGGRRLDADSFDSAVGAALSQTTNDTILAGTVAFSAATANLHVNGLLIATDGTFQTAGNTSDTDSSSVTIGSSPSVANPIDGYIAEIIVYQRALSAAERQRVKQALGRKWGITVA